MRQSRIFILWSVSRIKVIAVNDKLNRSATTKDEGQSGAQSLSVNTPSTKEYLRRKLLGLRNGEGGKGRERLEEKREGVTNMEAFVGVWFQWVSGCGFTSRFRKTEKGKEGHRGKNEVGALTRQ